MTLNCSFYSPLLFKRFNTVIEIVWHLGVVNSIVWFKTCFFSNLWVSSSMLHVKNMLQSQSLANFTVTLFHYFKYKLSYTVVYKTEHLKAMIESS